MSKPTNVQPLKPEAPLPDFIELGVPLPDKFRAHPELATKLKALAVAPAGASVLVLDTGHNAVSTRAILYLGKGNYASRKTPDGIRIWKLADRGVA